jgi:teichuronic acid biosynthesis glycosyltransferase TuaG
MKITDNNNLVSVVIPVYNAEKFIAQTIESVIQQTYQNYEIIIIDDCSNDNSAKIIKEYIGKNEHFLYHLQEKNMGVAVARNTGLKLAQGRYIAFLDSDDLWRMDKLQKQIAFMQQNGNMAFCYTAYDTITEHGTKQREKIKIKPIFTYQNFLTRTIIATPTVVLDRKMIGDVVMPLRRTGEDYLFWLILLKKYNAYGLEEALVHVRRRKGSLSKNKLRNLKDLWEIQHCIEKIPAIFTAFHIMIYVVNALIRKYL